MGVLGMMNFTRTGDYPGGCWSTGGRGTSGRRWRFSAARLAVLVVAAVLACDAVETAHSITVNNTADLVNAINAVNNGTEVTITFDSNITLTQELPSITGDVSNVTIEGQGNDLDGNGQFRGLLIDAAGLTITINDLTFKDLTAQGGDGGDGGTGGGGGAGLGGAIFVRDGTVELTDPYFESNTATGGAGGDQTGIGSGGGGGLGGDGGSQIADARAGGGGGGIGIIATGGNATNEAGFASDPTVINGDNGILSQSVPTRAGQGFTLVGGGAAVGDGGELGGGGAGSYGSEIIGGFGGGGGEQAAGIDATSAKGGDGGFGGGGGGGPTEGGAGGFGGGGGGAGGLVPVGQGGAGGFGGGGGAGGSTLTFGSGGFGAGSGTGIALAGGVGGGGLAAGGAIFVATGATVKVTYTATTSASNTFKDNTVAGGLAGDTTGHDGQNLGEALFLGSDTTVEVNGAFEATIDQTLGGAAGDANFDPEDVFATTYPDALGGIIKDGAGTLTLESDDNTYVGTTEVQSGTLIAEGGNAIGDYSPVDVKGTATLQLEDDETAGYLAGDVLSTVVLNGETLTLAGMIENDPGGDFQGQFDTNFQSNSKVIQEGTGQLTLSGDNSLVDYQLEIHDGTVIVGHQNAFGDASANQVKIYTDPYSSPDSLSNTLEASIPFTVANAIPNGFDIQSGKELKVGGNEDIALGGTIRSNSVAMIMDSPTKKLMLSNDSLAASTRSSYSKTRIFEGTLAVTSGQALGGSQIEVADNGGTLEAEGTDVFLTNTIKFLSTNRLAVGGNSVFNLTLGGAITGNGGITKTGTQTVTLAGANSYRAETQIEDGTLVAAGGQAIFDNGIVNFTLGGIFQVDDSETIGLLKSTGALGSVVLEPGANLTLQGASESVDEEFGGIISGSGELTKQGTYTQRLTGHNTYTGGTNIEDGKLGINFDDSLGVGGTVKLANEGTLLIVSSGLTLTYPLEVESSDGQIEWYDPGVPAGGHIFMWTPVTITGDGMMSVDLKGISSNISTFEVDQDATVDPSFGGFEPAEFTEVDFIGAGDITFVLIGPSGVFDASNKNVVYDTTSDRVFGGTLNDIAELQKKNTGTLTFNSDSTVTAATVAVENGTLAVEDSDFTVTNPGGTTISGGTLQLENDGLAGNMFNSNVTVDTGVLKGVGTIDGDVTNNGPVGLGGTIQPGSSSDPYGTLHLTGNFDNNGGAIDIEMQRTGGSYENSKILADGTAVIVDGSLVVNASAGTPFVVGEQVPFIEASSVVVTTDFSILTLTGGSHSGRYKLEPFHTGTAYGFVIEEGDFYQGIDHFCHNNFVMGDYFSNQTSSGIPPKDLDMNTVTAAILALTDQAPAYDELDGAVFGSASSVGVQATTNMFQLIGTRLRPNGLALCPAPTSMWRYGRTDNESLFRHGQPAAEAAWSGWVAVGRLGGDATGDCNAHGFDYTQNGWLAGIQRNLDFESNVGMFFNYSQSTIDVGDPDDTVTTENNFGGAYLTHDYGLGYSMVVAGFGHDQYESRRQISFLSPVRQADGDHDGWQAGIYTEHGLTYGLSNLFFQPYGALQYVYFGQDGFTETGADSINLVVDDFSFNSFRMMLGGRLAGSFWGPTWELRAQWIHELLHETSPIVGASFQGGWDPTFAIEGLSLGRDWALLGAGFDWQIRPRFSFFANYDWQVNGYQSFGVGSGGAEIRW